MDDALISILGDQFSRLQSSAVELLVVIHLGFRHSVIARRTSNNGSIEAIPFPLRSIVADALNLGSQEILLAHNHPSGIAQPSAADLDETRRLDQVLRALKIGLADHFILTRTESYSMRKAGLLGQIGQAQGLIKSGRGRLPETSNAAR